jgi:hypothetical protein
VDLENPCPSGGKYLSAHTDYQLSAVRGDHALRLLKAQAEAPTAADEMFTDVFAVMSCTG